MINENFLMMNLNDRKNLIILFIILIINLNVVNTCYITNCPWGGKRSQPFLDFENANQVNITTIKNFNLKFISSVKNVHRVLECVLGQKFVADLIWDV